jgi:hypothetical protein
LMLRTSSEHIPKGVLDDQTLHEYGISVKPSAGQQIPGRTGLGPSLVVPVQ